MPPLPLPPSSSLPSIHPSLAALHMSEVANKYRSYDGERMNGCSSEL